jgi:hypothetical protein
MDRVHSMKAYLEDAASGLKLLRATFPDWGFLYDPFAFRWIAVRGQRATITADTPEDLATCVGHHEVHGSSASGKAPA